MLVGALSSVNGATQESSANQKPRPGANISPRQNLLVRIKIFGYNRFANILSPQNFKISLKNCVLKLTPYLHQSNSGGILDEKVHAANSLCHAIERCLLQGKQS